MLRCLGYSATIAIAGCAPSKAKPQSAWRECVDTLTGESIRFDAAKAEDVGLLMPKIVVTDTDGFRRVLPDHLKCRDLASGTPTRRAETLGSVAEGDGGPTAESGDAHKEQP